MTIQEEIKSIIDNRNGLDNRELEKQLGFLVWEVKRVMLNKAREMLQNDNYHHADIDGFLVKLDEAVK